MGKSENKRTFTPYKFLITMKKVTILFSFLICVTFMNGQTMSKVEVEQAYNSLAQTPPMGWNSWNLFKGDINENLVKGIIDAFVEKGLLEAGYIYVNLDDCWHGKRDKDGFITVDAQKFPSGLNYLTDYAHSKGLKFGIYTCAGNQTCANYPGSLGHEYQDALQYARWGIDYIKEDWCNTPNLNPIGAYALMHDAILESGRPMLLSICEWGANKPWQWGKHVGGHCWRTTPDIENNFESVLKLLDMQEGLRDNAGPGHWNDPDMLEVGNGMSVNEDRAHFSLWCMLAAPLLLGNDVRNMSQETMDIILNKEVIAINQDKLGVQGFKHTTKDGLEIWFKPLVNDEWALCLFNRTADPIEYTIDWRTLDVNDDLSKRTTNFSSLIYQVHNLWAKKTEGNTKKVKNVTIPSHDVILYRLSPKSK